MSGSYIRAAIRRDVYWRDQAFACVYCIEGRDDVTTLDHVKSEHRDGLTRRKNLVKACWACNNEKGSIDLEFWAMQLQKDTNGRLKAKTTIRRVKRQLRTKCKGKG
jgi:hypothetical protein